jgi:serine/threonine protein kinase
MRSPWLTFVSAVVVCRCSAPELPLYGDGHYTFALDMWSAGCVLGELLKMMDPDREIPLTLFPVSRFIPDCTSA